MLLATVGHATWSPSMLAKVITLLEDMHKKAEEAIKEETALFDKFEAYIDEKKKKLTEDIVSSDAQISGASGALKKEISVIEAKNEELGEVLAKIEALDAEVAAADAKEAERKKVFTKESNDATDTVNAIRRAIDSLEASRQGPALLQKDAKLVKEMVYMAEAYGIKGARHSVSMLQKPRDYDFHSDGIISTLKDLEKEVDTRLTELKEENKKAEDQYSTFKDNKAAERVAAVGSQKAAMDARDNAKSEEADARTAITENNALLTESAAFLKDVTAQGQQKALSRQQRFDARTKEIAALTQGIDILKGTTLNGDKKAIAAGAATAAADATTSHTSTTSETPQETPQDVLKRLRAAADEQSLLQEEAVFEPAAFMQTKKVNLLAGKKEALKQKALDSLVAKFTKNEYLARQVEKMREGPIDKVIRLIYELVGRLQEEQAAEAEKDGFCNTEMGKAKKDQEFRFRDAQDAVTSIKELNLSIKTLKREIKELKQAHADGTDELEQARVERQEEKQHNADVVQTCNEAATALNSAFKLLKETYKGGHGNVGGLDTETVFLQQPDRTLEGAGAFEGADKMGEMGSAYTGQQGGADGVLGILEQVISDNDKELAETQEAEKQAHRAWVEYSTNQKVALKEMETSRELKQGQLAEDRTALNNTEEDLEGAMTQLNIAVEKLDKLHPYCVDTGMTFEQRVEKREAEIKALKGAVCTLDPENKEHGC